MLGDPLRQEEAKKKQAREPAGPIGGGAQPTVGKQTRSGALGTPAGGTPTQAKRDGARADSWEMTPELTTAMGLEEHAQRDQDDPFKVEQGQLTFDAEGTEGGRYHTRKAHWPGGASGVTIGRGYDLGQHGETTIVEDMTSAGIAEADAQKFSAASGQKGADAKAWLDEHGSELPEITAEQQEALFETTYAEHLADVKRISGNYATTKAKQAGKEGETADFEVNFDTLHPVIKDILVDLRYRGDYTPATRVHVQPLAIANDLKGLATVMADKEKWKSVPEDRFERRKKYTADAVAAAEQAPAEPASQASEPTSPASSSKSPATGPKSPASGQSASTAGAAVSAKPASGTATLKANVNVRQRAAMDGKILETAKKGATFKVLANVGSWYQVEHAGGAAYITTLPAFVTFEAAPAPRAEAPKPAAAPSASGGSEASSESWLDKAWNAATHLVDVAMSFFSGSEEEQKEAEGEETETATTTKTPLGGKAGSGAETGGGSESGGAQAQPPAVPGGSLLFKDSFEIIDGNAKLRDAKLAPNGKTIAKGAKVFVVKAEKTFVQIVTPADAEHKIVEADQIWTAFSNLGGTGAPVGLGNEKSDEADKTKADELRAGLPPGRNAGKSAYKWQFSGTFQPSLEGKALEGSLMSKVQALMQWAVENDMVTGDIVIGDGVRGPKTAHKMCVSWNIQYRWDSVVTLVALKALPGGKDEDGTVWYQDGWGEDEIKQNAKNIRASEKIAAAGYDYGDTKRLPLPLNSRPGVSRHCTGRAVDVTIPWRAPGKDASTNATDVWAWEEVYKQFGLHRPLHKTLVSSANLQENWHIEETGKKLDDDGTDD